MTITPDHWLDGAVRVKYPAGPDMFIRRFAVMHFTGGATAQSSIDYWKTPEAKGAEAHVIVDRDGTIYQIRPFNQRCDHVGISDWKCPRTNVVFSGLNDCSIGIEFANAGDSANEDGTAFSSRKFKIAAFQKARHKQGGPMTAWEVYPEVQIKTGLAIAQAIVKRYNLDDLIGHEDCAFQLLRGKKHYDRKQDPGPLFPMAQFRAACGFPPDVPKRS